MTNKKKRNLNLFSWLLIITGIMLCLYPLYTYVYAQYEQKKLADENPVILMGTPQLTAPSAPEPPAGDQPAEAAPQPAPESAKKPEVIAKPVKAMALLEIPKIKVSVIVISGTSQDVLAKGAGWYEQSALPGKGNTAIAAHNNIYGAWFRNVYKLVPGDEMHLTYQGKKYTYVVEKVYPIATNDWSVIAPTKDTVLTLTTCHTKTERLACRAVLKNAE